jgi:hypothetical protein
MNNDQRGQYKEDFQRFINRDVRCPPGPLPPAAPPPKSPKPLGTGMWAAALGSRPRTWGGASTYRMHRRRAPPARWQTGELHGPRIATPLMCDTGGSGAQYGHGPYIQKLEKLLDSGETRLMLDINELRADSPDLARG